MPWRKDRACVVWKWGIDKLKLCEYCMPAILCFTWYREIHDSGFCLHWQVAELYAQYHRNQFCQDILLHKHMDNVHLKSIRYMLFVVILFCQLIAAHGGLENSTCICVKYPDSKVHGANMGPTWVLPAPDEPHDGPINFVIWVATRQEMLLWSTITRTCLPVIQNRIISVIYILYVFFQIQDLKYQNIFYGKQSVFWACVMK